MVWEYKQPCSVGDVQYYHNSLCAGEKTMLMLVHYKENHKHPDKSEKLRKFVRFEAKPKYTYNL